MSHDIFGNSNIVDNSGTNISVPAIDFSDLSDPNAAFASMPTFGDNVGVTTQNTGLVDGLGLVNLGAWAPQGKLLTSESSYNVNPIKVNLSETRTAPINTSVTTTTQGPHTSNTVTDIKHFTKPMSELAKDFKLMNLESWATAPQGKLISYDSSYHVDPIKVNVSETRTAPINTSVTTTTPGVHTSNTVTNVKHFTQPLNQVMKNYGTLVLLI